MDAATFLQYQKVHEQLTESRLAREAELQMEQKIAKALRDMEAQGVKARVLPPPSASGGPRHFVLLRLAALPLLNVPMTLARSLNRSGLQGAKAHCRRHPHDALSSLQDGFRRLGRLQCVVLHIRWLR